MCIGASMGACSTCVPPGPEGDRVTIGGPGAGLWSDTGLRRCPVPEATLGGNLREQLFGSNCSESNRPKTVVREQPFRKQPRQEQLRTPALDAPHIIFYPTFSLGSRRPNPLWKMLMPEHVTSLKALVGRRVVLDTASPVTFLGTLVEVCPDGYWLADADFRDRTEGHDTKERYICEALEFGIRPNRKRLFVFGNAVISISALEDVVPD